MKNLLVISALLISGAAFAQTPSPVLVKGQCRAAWVKAEQACVAAGFVKGGHKNGNNGLFMDCLGKLKTGASVDKVTLDDATKTTLVACKEKHQERKAERKAARAAVQGQTPTPNAPQ